MERGPSELCGVYPVNDLKTVGDAITLMLETNQWLKPYQEQNRIAWESQWEGESGKIQVSAPAPEKD